MFLKGFSNNLFSICKICYILLKIVISHTLRKLTKRSQATRTIPRIPNCSKQFTKQCSNTALAFMCFSLFLLYSYISFWTFVSRSLTIQLSNTVIYLDVSMPTSKHLAQVLVIPLKECVLYLSTVVIPKEATPLQ